MYTIQCDIYSDKIWLCGSKCESYKIIRNILVIWFIGYMGYKGYIRNKEIKVTYTNVAYCYM